MHRPAAGDHGRAGPWTGPGHDRPPSVADSTQRESARVSDPRPVVVEGYDDHLMEPFVTRDGKFLLFNNSNEPPEKTSSLRQAGQ